MYKTGIKPEEVLADTDNFVDLNGISVRKGSIAAFLKNIDILEGCTLEQEKIAALDMIKQLAPAIIAAGLYKHAVFKNKTVQEIIEKGSI